MKVGNFHWLKIIVLIMFGFGIFSCQSQKFSIAPLYDAVMPFHYGIAAVKVNDQWGFLDNKGYWVMEPKFTSVSKTEAGDYLVEETAVDFIEKLAKLPTGQWALQPYYGQIKKIQTRKGNKYIEQHGSKYIISDHSDKPLTKEEYDHIIYIGDELFIGNKIYEGDVLIDVNGKEISNYYQEISSETVFGRIRMRKNDHYGLLATSGKEIVKPEMTVLEIVGHNIAFTKGGDMQLYTDELKRISEFKFDRVVNLGNHNYIARNATTGESKWFNAHGALMESQWKVSDGQLVNGLFPASNKNDEWGYVNSDGKEVIPFSFRYAESFWPNGKAVVWKNRYDKLEKSIIDTLGKEFQLLHFDKIEWHEDGIYRIEYGNKNQLLDENFSPITGPAKDRLEYIGNGVYIKYKTNASLGIQKWNPYTGDKFKIYKSKDVEIEGIYALDGSLLVKGSEFNEEESLPKVSEGFAMAKKGKKWGYINCSAKVKNKQSHNIENN